MPRGCIGNWSYSATVLNLGSNGSGQLEARPLYYRGKRPGYPLERRLVGPQSRFARCGEEKNSSLPGIESRPPNILVLVAFRKILINCPLFF
jgi:hypothetical protein